MSDLNTGAPAPSTPTTPNTAAPANEAAPVNLDSISGAKASELVAKSKATGRPIEELLKEEASTLPPKHADGRGPDGKFLRKESDAPAKEDPLKEAVAEAKRRMKIGDEEVDEDEVVRIYKERKGHQRAANEELQKGKAARRQAEQLISILKDPEGAFAILAKLGHDPRALAEKHLVRQLEEENMDPREKELRDTRRQLQHYADMEKKKLEADEARVIDEMKQKFVKEYETNFTQALQESGLPPTKAVIAEMAKYISKAAKFQKFKMTPAEAASLVKEDMMRAQKNLYGNADGETLLKLLGDDVAKKILMARGGQVKQNPFSTPTEQPARRELGAKSGTRMTQQEWRRFNRAK